MSSDIAPYKLVKSRRRSIGISLDRDGNVIVRAPMLCTKKEIESALRKAEGWIERTRAKLDRVKAEAEGAGALSEADIRKLGADMLRVLPEKLMRYSALLDVEYGRVSVRNQRSKWGSCSAKGNLNFNCLLMLAPEEVMDYVIVHELCHLKHPDHSKAFWAEVESVDPDYKAHKKWLKDHGGALIARMMI